MEDMKKEVRVQVYMEVKEKLYLNMSKCELRKTSLVYLGHIIGWGELNIDRSKVDVTVNWHKLNNVTEVGRFWEKPNIGEIYRCNTIKCFHKCETSLPMGRKET